MKDASELKKFALAMAFFIPFVAFCLFIIGNALKPGQRIVTPEVVNAIAPTQEPIPVTVDTPKAVDAAPVAIAAQPIEVPSTIYVVKEGDTLSYIAMVFTGKPSNYKKIAADNNIDNPDLIFPGQKIKVPLE
jgi:2',3'-cyclic-nucleotide 2'-phosphodiesterase/3'-nucleotidase